MKVLLNKWIVLSMLGCALLVFAGCGGDNGPTGSTIKNNKLVLDFFNIEPLSSGWHFQAWAHKDNAWIAGPSFDLDAQDDLVDLQGNSLAGNKITFTSTDLTFCDSLAVTVHQNGSGTSYPTGGTILIGDIDTLSAGLESPLYGKVDPGFLYFVFSTPTDSDTTMANQLSGVWFTGSDLASAGLEMLPTLPADWIFEGWVRHGDVILSTGKFTSNEGSDLSNTYYSNTAGAPPYPGEDFLINAPAGVSFPMQLAAGDTVMISLEQVADPNPDSPFIRWYARKIPSGVIFPAPLNIWTLSRVDTQSWPTANAFISND